MTINFLDIAPISSWERAQMVEARKKAEQEKKQQEKLQKEQEKAEKQAEKTEKAKKKAEKAKKKAEKAKKKAEKAKKKAEKAEKKALKEMKDMSATATVTTVEVPAGQTCEPTCAAMPTGVVLAVCASLLICCGSAWFFRRFNSDTTASK